MLHPSGGAVSWATRRLLASGPPCRGATHQLAGTPGSVVDPNPLPGPGLGPSGGSSIGQLHHRLVHQQTVWDTLPDSVSPGPGHVGMVGPTGHCASSCPPAGDTQRPNRRAVKGEVLPKKVVPAP